MIKFVIWLIACSSTIFGIIYLYYKYVNPSYKISKRIVISTLICMIILTIVNYYNIVIVNRVSYFILCPPLFYLIYYDNFGKYIYYVLIIWIYGMLTDLIAMGLVTILHHFYNFDIYSYIFEASLTVFVSILLLLFAHSKKLKNFTNNLYNKISKMYFFNLSLVLFSIFTLLIGIVVFLNLRHLKITFLLILIFALIILIFILLIKGRINAIENTIFLKTLKDSHDFYVKMDDENRIFRHNLNAKLLSIKSVSNKKAKFLLEDLLKENNGCVNISNKMNVVPYGLNGIIYEKIYPYINNLDIKIDNNIDDDIFDLLKPRRYNVFVEKMVVILDNAIEACLNSTDKKLVFNLYVSDCDVVIEIRNTFANEINMENLGVIGYSTKGNKRGLGLFSSLRSNEASLSVKIHNNLFISKIVAKKNIH